jgi:hypothetical protein
MSSLVKFCGCLSILRNSVWVAMLMIAWSLINPQYKYAMLLRIGLKIMEFYIIWSTYGTFKLFEGSKKVRMRKGWKIILYCGNVISKNYHALHFKCKYRKETQTWGLWKSSSHLLLIKSCLLFSSFFLSLHSRKHRNFHIS